jgi:hypothetical protein
LRWVVKRVAEALLQAIGDLLSDTENGAQLATNPNRHSIAFPHVVRIRTPGVKVEAIFQMTSVLRANALGLKTWWNSLE